MASDFDKLFPDDGFPHDPDMDGPPRGRRKDDNLGRSPFEPFIPSSGADNYTSEIENRAPRVLNEKEVKVTGVFIEQEAGSPAQHFVYLKDNKGRKGRIYVGHFEAFAIQFAYEGTAPVRPMTHDLIKIVVERLDARIERVVIDDLWSEVFYAKIGVVTTAGVNIDIDSRPSDAIAIALRNRVPIYMAESVIEATFQQD